jgi:hypothetical protein
MGSAGCGGPGVGVEEGRQIKKEDEQEGDRRKGEVSGHGLPGGEEGCWEEGLLHSSQLVIFLLSPRFVVRTANANSATR